MSEPVAEHYAQRQLLARITEGIGRLGLSTENLDPAVLASLDEFHIGGLPASQRLFDQLGIVPGAAILDLGCGLGGPARYVAGRFRATVTGVDLTEDFVEIGNVLCTWCGLSGQVALTVGDALDLPFDDESFDLAYMMHVGMNIACKSRLATEVWRVLRPGGRFAIYDVMQVGGGAVTFPVPWAASPDISALGSPGTYRSALEGAGFTVIAETDRTEFALAFFEEVAAKMAAAEGPPPLGLHLVMGEMAPQMVANMMENISGRLIAPVEMIARKSGRAL